MGISKFPAVLIFALVVVVTVTVTSRVAEAQVTSCASSLAPCANYTNGTGTGTPPASCCTPLEEAVRNQFVCFCNLYANNTQVTGLLARCPSQIRIGCPSAPAPTSTSSVPSPPRPPGTIPPPPPPGVGRIAWAGLPSLLFFWASMMLY